MELATLATSIVSPQTELCIHTIRGTDGDLVFHVVPSYDVKVDSGHSLINDPVPLHLYIRTGLTGIGHLLDVVRGGRYSLRSASISQETRHVQAFFSDVDDGYDQLLHHFLWQHPQLRHGLLEIGFVVTCRGVPRDVVRLVMATVMATTRRTWIGMRFYIRDEEFPDTSRM
jgi:hypothetical protein